MKRILLMISFLVAATVAMTAQEYKWSYADVDGSRTGCITPSKENIAEAIGTFEGSTYVAPNGTKHKKSSAAAKTAKAVLEAQGPMARVKDVVAYSTEFMDKGFPESPLSNWLIDILIAKTENLAGKPVHMGVTNFGGIRVDMPKGDIILDDMLSMFPFKNQLVYVEHTGKELRAILEEMAEHRFQVLGGVRVVADQGKLVSAEIDGEPIDDNRIYGVATISFLLEGGDGLTLKKNAVSVTSFPDVDIIDAVLEYVYAETAAGRPIQYQKDGRVVVKGNNNKKRK